MHEQLAKAIQQVPTNDRPLTRSDFTTTNGTGGERTKVAEYQARRPVAIRPDRRVRLALVTHENKSTDGSGGTQTFNLSRDLIDAGSTDQSLALFENGTPVDPDSVDFANDSFDYTGPGSTEDLEVYYTVGPGDQCPISIEKHAPKDVNDELWSGDLGLLNARDQDKSAIEIDFSHPLDPIIPTDWYLRVYAEGPYAVEWDESTNNTSAPNALLSFKTRMSNRSIDGLGRAVRHRIADK